MQILFYFFHISLHSHNDKANQNCHNKKKQLKKSHRAHYVFSPLTQYLAEALLAATAALNHWVWWDKLCTLGFGDFPPFLSSEDPLKLCQVGCGPMVNHHFQVFLEIFYWVQVWALAKPLKRALHTVLNPWILLLSNLCLTLGYGYHSISTKIPQILYLNTIFALLTQHCAAKCAVWKRCRV